MPFLHGKDMFSVRVDKFCFSVLFDETEIRRARGDFRIGRTVFSQPHDFPARRNKAVILLFFVLFQFLIDIEQIIVDKDFFRVAALFGRAAVAERGTSALSRDEGFSRKAHDESGNKSRDCLYDAHGNHENFDDRISSRLFAAGFFDAIDVALRIGQRLYVRKFRIGDDEFHVQRGQVQPINFRRHVFDEIVVRVPAHAVRIKQYTIFGGIEGGIFIEAIAARDAFIIAAVFREQSDSGSHGIHLHGGEHFPVGGVGHGHKFHVVSGDDVRFGFYFVVEEFGINSRGIIDGKCVYDFVVRFGERHAVNGGRHGFFPFVPIIALRHHLSRMSLRFPFFIFGAFRRGFAVTGNIGAFKFPNFSVVVHAELFSVAEYESHYFFSVV